MKKNILLLLIVICCTAQIFAQQLGTYTLYRDHWNMLNPAAISNNFILNELTLSANASYHRQWGTIDDGGAPTLQTLGIQNVNEDYNIVYGGHIINDKTGLIGSTGLYGNFGYRLVMGRRFDQSLVIGLSAGLVQYRAKISEIAFVDPELTAVENEAQFFPDFSLGIFYHYDDQFYAGISVPQTFGLSTEFRTAEKDFSIERSQHVYAIIGAYFDAAFLGNEASFIEPSIWIKYVPNAPISADLNARYQYGQTFWVGLGGGISAGERVFKNAHFETGVIIGEGVGLNYGQFKIGVGFDWFFAPVSVLGNGFEVSLGYSW